MAECEIYRTVFSAFKEINLLIDSYENDLIVNIFYLRIIQLLVSPPPLICNPGVIPPTHSIALFIPYTHNDLVHRNPLSIPLWNTFIFLKIHRKKPEKDSTLVQWICRLVVIG